MPSADRPAPPPAKPDELRALLDATVDAIVIIDERGAITRFSKAAERTFGYSESEVLGRNVSTLMPEPHKSAHDDYLTAYRDTGTRKIIGIGRDVIARRKDGSTFPAELSVGEASLGSARRFVGVVRDVSQKRRDADELRKQREVLAHVDRIGTMGEMATGIAHEVNQPLTAIATFAQTTIRLLDADRLPSPRLRDILTDISNEAARAGDIIHRLRRLVKRQVGQIEICNINEIVSDVWQLAKLDADYHEVPLRLDLGEGLPSVRVDRIQIQQVIMNLLRNAVDATAPQTKPHTPVTLSSRRDNVARRVILTVADSGVGVKNPERLFESFVSSKDEGLGLGLPISRNIAESHGGELTFEEGNPGARFHFSLPYVEDEK